jgi:hypothetical protein
VPKHLRYFEDEEAAARAYDEAAIERGLLTKLNFDNYELPETAAASLAPKQSSSQFQGVHWATSRNEWITRLRVQGVQKHLGSFDDEEAAARAYDEAVIEHGLFGQLSFDKNDRPSASPAPRRGSSRFRGVYWDTATRKWRAVMQVEGVKKHLGRFEDEEAAARVYDEAAIEHGLLDHVNFDDYDRPSASPAAQGGSSRFRGVCWAAHGNKWTAQMTVQGVRKHLGYCTRTRNLQRGPLTRLPSSAACWTGSTLTTMLSFLRRQ